MYEQRSSRLACTFIREVWHSVPINYRSEQQRPRSACACAQADLDLRCSHMAYWSFILHCLLHNLAESSENVTSSLYTICSDSGRHAHACRKNPFHMALCGYKNIITKTYLYNFDPLKPHLYIVKLGFTGVYIILSYFCSKHRLWVLVRTASLRRF